MEIGPTCEYNVHSTMMRFSPVFEEIRGSSRQMQVKPGMFGKLIDSLRTMRKRGIFLTALGVVLTGFSYISRKLDPNEIPLELFSMIALSFFLYGMIIAVHNTNAIAPMFFSFRYTKAKLFSRRKSTPDVLADADDESYVPVDEGGFHYELYSDYLRDRRKWSGMAASFALAAIYFLIALAFLPMAI